MTHPFEYDFIGVCNGGYCRARNGANWGVLKAKGGILIPPVYDSMTGFTDGFVAAEDSNRWFLIDDNGEAQKFPADVRKLYSPSEGLVRFEGSKRRIGYMRVDGEIAIEAKFAKAQPFSEGLAAVSDGQSWGFVDQDGDVKIGFKFRSASRFNEGLAAVQNQQGNWGYIDVQGRWIVAPTFKKAYEVRDGRSVYQSPSFF